MCVLLSCLLCVKVRFICYTHTNLQQNKIEIIYLNKKERASDFASDYIKINLLFNLKKS